MKPNIHIHIGLHKTGSTSIQHTLFNNRARLLARGFNYLDLGANHSDALFPLLINKPYGYLGYRHAGIDTPEKAARKNAQTLAALRRELKANASENFVISGEELSALGLVGTERLRDLLAPYAKSIRIIVYIREPYATVNSIVQQRMNRGETYAEIAARPPRPRYARLGPAVRVFGRDNVDIRLFDPKHFVYGDLIADFLAAIGAPPALAGELETVRANVSLSHEAAFLMNEVNKRNSGLKGRARTPGRATWLSQRLVAIPGQPYRCPPEIIDAAAPLIARDLRWLHELLGKDVFPDRRPSSDTLPPRWSDETLAGVAGLIDSMATEIERQRRTERGLLGSLKAKLRGKGKA